VTSRALLPSHFPWFDYSRYSFSLGLAVGSSLYLSGHSASEYDRERGAIVVKGGMAEQARTAWTKIAAILEAGGCTLADIVRAVEYVTQAGIRYYADAERARGEMLGDRRSALNTVVVEQLLRPQALIEIEVVARPSGAAQGSRSKECGSGADTGGRRGPRGRAVAAWEDDGIVYLSSLLPTDRGGQLIAPGDVVGQTRAIYRRAALVLDSLQLGLDNIVKTIDYLTPAALGDYARTAEVRRECLAPAFPASTGIVMPRVAHPDALIQVDIIASRRSREITNPGWSNYDKLTFSPGVRTGNLLFMSGVAALDAQTGRSVHQGNIATQAEYIYNQILEVVASAGGSAQHLVKTIEYVTAAGLPGYREVANVRTRIMCAPLPASTGVVCAGLLRPEFQLEVDAFAVID
jgi:enamine deaminase RidA (YjgF/YER057c/UK114 family)